MDELPEHLRQYLAICKQVYERMERDGTWPWKEGDELGDTVSPEDDAANPKQRSA